MTPVEKLRAQLADDTPRQPGEEGFWQVWGASWADVQPGDIIVTKDEKQPDGLALDEVAECNPYHNLVQAKLVTTAGQTYYFGQYFRGWILMRWGTRHTLSPYAR